MMLQTVAIVTIAVKPVMRTKVACATERLSLPRPHHAKTGTRRKSQRDLLDRAELSALMKPHLRNSTANTFAKKDPTQKEPSTAGVIPVPW